MEIAYKHCEICGEEFIPKRVSQKYCPDCGENPVKARRALKTAERINRKNAGDWYKPLAKAICKECGKEFFAIRSKSYCSDLCRHSHRVKETRCPVCGASLWGNGIESERDVCCSPECKEKYDVQNAIKNERYLACGECGKMFIAHRDSQKYCCRACYLANAKKKEKVHDEKDDEEAGLRKCRLCGKIYQLTDLWYSDVFCSPECRDVVRTGKSLTRPKLVRKQAKQPEKTNVCLACKTSQAQCERFTSRFVYIPKGAVMEKVKGKNVVVSCPKLT